MNKGRTNVSLGEVCEVKHGFAFPGDGFSDVPTYPTLLTPGNFAIGGGFQDAKTKTFAGAVPDGYLLNQGDIIVTMTDLSKDGDTLGFSARVPGGKMYLHNQRVGLIKITRPDTADINYLGWLMRGRDYRAHVLGSATGSTVRHTSPSRILDFKTTLPPLPEQRRIARLLGALDDLIEMNTRLINDLIATADTIALSVDRAGKTLTLGDVANISGGGTPSTKDSSFWDGDINWATPTDMTALPSPYLFSTSRTITEMGLKACSSKLFPPGTILMTSRATIGVFAIVQAPVAVNQGFIVVEPIDEIDRFFLFHEMRRRVPEFIQKANGSTFLEISRGTFKSLPVVWPDADTRRHVSDVLIPIHQTSAELQREITEIRRTRDELLPIILSGAVTVAEVAA